VDDVDDLGVVDALSIDAGDAGWLWPSWRWITTSGTPWRVISTAWVGRGWCGAKRC